MKIRVQLKDPDGFSECVDEAVAAEVEALGLDEDEADAVKEKRVEKAWSVLEAWVKYQEYVTIEFDTEAKTATVVKL